jgi:DNA topoisomerase-2
MLLRPDTFVGSVEDVKLTTYAFNEKGYYGWREINYNPALLKIFDEVIQNCYDHSTRPDGKRLTRIDVGVSPLTGEITVMDNCGIPVVMHPVYKKYVPCIIFGELRSGTNYNDNDKRTGAGRNGLGAKLTNVFSSFFKVETADGKNKYEKVYESNRRDEEDPVIKPSTSRYTKISFIPDYDILNTKLTQDNIEMMYARVYEIAASAPHLDVYLNGKKIAVKGFESFVKQFGTDYLYIDSPSWKVGLLHSKTGFKQASFVNSTNTRQGGTHVEYVADQLVDGIREYIKKKTKQDVKPSDIRNHFHLFIDATVENPTFSGQTKEFMTLKVSSYGTSIKFDEKFIKKLIKSDIVAEIVEWAINRKKLQDMADLKKLAKTAVSTSSKEIPKYTGASQKTNRDQCKLFICEGDSAEKPLKAARNPILHGVFALKGKPMSLPNAKPDEIKKNKEIFNLMAATGLELGKPPKDLRYGQLIISTDADPDGSHIRGLMINNIQFEWIDLIKEGRLFILQTPLVRVIQGSKVHEFLAESDFEVWQAKQAKKNYEIQYLKGLGGNSTEDFEKYMNDTKYHLKVEYSGVDDINALALAFGDSDTKKRWLYPDSF